MDPPSLSAAVKSGAGSPTGIRFERTVNFVIVAFQAHIMGGRHAAAAIHITDEQYEQFRARTALLLRPAFYRVN